MKRLTVRFKWLPKWKSLVLNFALDSDGLGFGLRLVLVALDVGLYWGPELSDVERGADAELGGA